MRVERVLETCLYSVDLEAAEEFYSHVLGLELFACAAGRHVFFRCGNAVCLVFNPERTRISSGEVPTHGALGSGHVAFAVHAGDTQAWREQLLEHGITIEAEFSWPNGGHSLYFRDPGGNSVELTTPRTWDLPDQDDIRLNSPDSVKQSDKEQS